MFIPIETPENKEKKNDNDDDDDNEFKCSSISYIPQISLPIEKVRLEELKEVIDGCMNEILPFLKNKDKDNYFVSNFHEEDEATVEYFENLEKLLKTTIKDNIHDSKIFKDFIKSVDIFDVYHSEPIFYSSQTKDVKDDDIKTQLFIAEI